MTELSTAAWVGHNLGLAAWFGGTLFGKFALNPSVKVISSKDERGKVLNSAWNRYNVVNAASLGTAAGTWVTGRAMLSGDEIGEDARNLVLAKDVLLGAGAVTGLASGVGGVLLSRQDPEGATPAETGDEPAPETPEPASTIQRWLDVLGNVNIVLAAAVIAITTVLAMKSGESSRWSVVSRLLP
jgi:hypothetical protein